MTDQPEYIDLLNDIRLQEHRAGIWIKAWADKTEHPGLKGCLSLVAERETSHGDIFDRRIRELGGTPEDRDDELFHERLRVAESDMTDAEKIAAIREFQTRMTLPTVRMRYEEAANDESVDQLTRSLIKWFTEVEDDSGAAMRAVYAEIEAGS